MVEWKSLHNQELVDRLLFVSSMECVLQTTFTCPLELSASMIICPFPQLRTLPSCLQ